MNTEAENYIANITNFITALMAIKRHLQKDGAPSTVLLKIIVWIYDESAIEWLFAVYQFEKPAFFSIACFILVKKGKLLFLEYLIPIVP